MCPWDTDAPANISPLKLEVEVRQLWKFLTTYETTILKPSCQVFKSFPLTVYEKKLEVKILYILPCLKKTKSRQTGSWCPTALTVSYNVQYIMSNPAKFQINPIYGFWEKLDESFSYGCTGVHV